MPVQSSQPSPFAQPSAEPSGRERRTPQNQRLRRLIDEMMATLREAATPEPWTMDAHTRYERDLDRILARVRREALARTRPQDEVPGQGH